MRILGWICTSPNMNGGILTYNSNPNNVWSCWHKNRGNRQEKNSRYISIRRPFLKQTAIVIYQCDEMSQAQLAYCLSCTLSTLAFLWQTFSLNLYLLAALGLRCCMQTFSSCGKQGLLFVVVLGFRWLLFVAEHRLQELGLQYLHHTWAQQLRRAGSRAYGLQQLWHMGLAALQHVQSSQTRDQNPCSLHWQVDSYRLYHPGSAGNLFMPVFNPLKSWV